MKVREVMSSHPILVRADEEATVDLRRLIKAGKVHHLPVVDARGWWASGSPPRKARW